MRKTGLLSALDFSRVTASLRTSQRLLLTVVVVGLFTGCLSLLFLHENPASALTPPDFTDTRVMSVESPTALAFTPDGRLLVTSEPGRLRVYKDGALLPNPALDISGKVCTNGARGLLGIAVDPDFATNNYIYLYYTFKKHGVCPQNTANVPVNRVERYVLSDSNTATPDKILVDNIPNMHHNNAGDLHFGKDGYLYITVGDGACDYAGDSGCSGQNDASRDPHILLGKVLRITRDGGIPNTNPYTGTDSARCNLTGRTTVGKKCQETFASGLRNPFRFAFDPNASDTRFFVNDVGEGRWEEVSEGSAGADFAWNLCEGNHDNGARPGSVDCGAAPYTPPVHDYSHDTGCSSITAAAFVPNGVWPAAYDNSYLFGDYTCGKIFKLTPDGAGGYTRTEFVTGLGENSAVAMTFGPHQGSQALYYTTYGGNGPGSGGGGGEVRRIAYTGSTNRSPTAKVVANPTSGSLDLIVNFDASGSSDPDAGDTLTSYRWDFGDGSPTQTTTSPTTSHRYSTNGIYTASLRVEDNHGALSDPETVRIDAGNQAPTPVIESPSADMLFRVDQKITLSGSATDPDDPPQDPSLKWEVLQHHTAPNHHTHPYFSGTGNNLTITAPMPEGLISTGAGNHLEVRLTATDSTGLSKTVTRDVQPNRVNVSFATNPSALELLINGETFTTPKTLVSWEGYRLNVNAPSPQTLSGTPYVFSAWSDSQGQQHEIVTGATPSSYTATFTATSTACTQNGTSRGETLNGTSGADVICGMGGNDTIDGRGGNDILRGGGGADKLKGNAGDDELYGENGKDKLNSRDGVRGNDYLDGGAGSDTRTTDPTERAIVGFP
ncbi:MAG TPA: PQQ-dependent sugar dehydrogenase [Rubrobacter sp.]|jgi:glucose/arabinose dehydrogenase/PKD repeat protein|nr:PQQ-dependent sugar dehydrogenase [Rubrobacter sp.]